MRKWIYGHNKADYLFSDSVDEGRTKGYQEHTFTADEPFNMLTFNQTASGWDKFCLKWESVWSFGKSSWDFGPEQQDPVEPIRLVKDGDFTGADTADARKLYVHTEDFDEFESFYTANKSTKNVFLLRFAVTDYYSNLQTVITDLTWWNPSTWQSGTQDKESTYMARETVFLDFDIIEREIRRLIPKGTDLCSISDERVQAVESWANNYPREIFGYATSAELFASHLQAV